MTTDVATLKRFVPLSHLSQQQLEYLAEQSVLHDVPPKFRLIACGSNDPTTYLLLDGTIKLTAEDGRIATISSGQPSSMVPISQLLPRKYDVVTTSPTRYLTIDHAIISSVMRGETQNANSSGYEVSGDDEHEESEFEQELIQQFMLDLENDKLVLPSLPDVAVRLSKALRDDITDAHKIAEMIQTDPVISAKLIKAANSAMYSGRSHIETCTAAVIRLGTDVTHNLVVAYAVSELFKTDSPLLQKMMHELWQHSRKVAAICYVLAKHDSRFNPEQAMLIGLLHDIGVVAVLNYAMKFKDAASDRQTLKSASQRLRAQVGSLILRKWSFSTDFIVAALEGELWLRNPGPEPDYCDLVVIAQLHSFLGTERAMSTPGIDEVPAHTKLAIGELTPRMSLNIIEESHELLNHAESLLAF